MGAKFCFKKIWAWADPYGNSSLAGTPPFMHKEKRFLKCMSWKKSK